MKTVVKRVAKDADEKDDDGETERLNGDAAGCDNEEEEEEKEYGGDGSHEDRDMENEPIMQERLIALDSHATAMPVNSADDGTTARSSPAACHCSTRQGGAMSCNR